MSVQAPTPPSQIVGAAVPRREGVDKVTGAARYIDDIAFPGMIHGVTVRSPATPSPRGRLRAVHFGDGVPWDEITVVTARDIPGDNLIALIREDQPCLVDGVYNHPEEPVLLLAHPDPAVLCRARDAVRFDVDPLPAVLSIEAAEAPGAPIIWGQDNLLYRLSIDKGDVDAALTAPGVRPFEGVYRTAAQEQLYIENNGVIAVASEDGGVTVWGSLQCPYYIQKALMRLFGVGADRARVVQATTGGGFGGKEEYPSILACHAALLARKAGRPVKMIYDRAEDMAATTKRHPSRTKIRAGVTPDGRLVALDIEFDIDGGAYATLSQVVLSRGAIHAAGPYACDHVRVRARAFATNTPPHGAFRGFGAPQSVFALERHLDEIARALALDPAALRQKNLIAPGGTLATGGVVRDDVDLQALLARGLELSDYAARRQRFAEENRRPGALVRRGMGLAVFLHGTGFTGSGEKHLASVVAVDGTADGRLRVRTSSTEIGQGTNTVFAQIAAQAAGLAYEDVDVAATDTANVPDSGPTVASRTCTIVGRLVQDAARALRQLLIDGGLLSPEDRAPDAVRAAIRRHVATLGPLVTTAQYQTPPEIQWDEVRYRGDAYGAYSYAVYVAQVRVDLLTYEARVEDFVALQEVGRVIHPILAEGQIEGGVAQGVGWALYEDVAWKDGRMANNRMTDYIIPTAADIPPIRVYFQAPGDGYRHGAFGAKGIGELPMDGPAPAILNAIRDALGVSIDRVPATPEVIMAALQQKAAAR